MSNPDALSEAVTAEYMFPCAQNLNDVVVRVLDYGNPRKVTNCPLCYAEALLLVLAHQYLMGQ